MKAVDDRTAYHREYYRRTCERRRELAAARRLRLGVPPRLPADPERRRQSARAWRANNAERVRLLCKQWAERNPEKKREKNRRSATQQFLAEQAGCPFGAIPRELVDAKILLIELQKELRSRLRNKGRK